MLEHREEEGEAERKASFLERERGGEIKLAGNFPPILVPKITWCRAAALVSLRPFVYVYFQG